LFQQGQKRPGIPHAAAVPVTNSTTGPALRVKNCEDIRTQKRKIEFHNITTFL
jgi:hypothetical protein